MYYKLLILLYKTGKIAASMAAYVIWLWVKGRQCQDEICSSLLMSILNKKLDIEDKLWVPFFLCTLLLNNTWMSMIVEIERKQAIDGYDNCKRSRSNRIPQPRTIILSLLKSDKASFKVFNKFSFSFKLCKSITYMWSLNDNWRISTG